MTNINDVKNEGKGFRKALDAKGKWIVAADNKKCTTGYCPFCGCEMYLTHRGELYYFARKSGKVHCNPICLQIEENGKYYSVEKTSFEELIESLCHVGVPRGPSGPREPKGGEGGDKPAGGYELLVEVSDETGFTCLKQIYDYQLEQMKYQTDNEVKKIKEYILHHDWARKILENNKGDLVNRIVYVKFLYADDFQYMLHFSMYGKGWNSRFILRFKSLTDFKYYFGKLMKKEKNDNGSVSWKKKTENQMALIAAKTWERLNEIQSKRMCGADKYYDECLGVYMASFSAKGQLYFPPAL